MKRIVAALSGGVDSSAVAVMAQEAGYEVIGVNLRMNASDPAAAAVLEEVVSRLGIELHVIDCKADFLQDVLIPAAKEYEQGRTPNPCCSCNRNFKFAQLLRFAEKIRASEVWTGHYAKITKTPDAPPVLECAEDSGKDQSYFLYRLTPEMLNKIHFPLGNMKKEQVRAFAAERNFNFSKRPDSQDVCFGVPGESCGETLRRAAGLPRHPGKFIFNGKVVGKHDGFHRFTIGQRNGHGVALGVPAYISKINAATGNIELETDKKQLLSASFILRDINLLTASLPDRAEIRIRYRSRPALCRIEQIDADALKIIPDEPLSAVTPGQSGVLYLDSKVLGGGIISEIFPCC